MHERVIIPWVYTTVNTVCRIPDPARIPERILGPGFHRSPAQMFAFISFARIIKKIDWRRVIELKSLSCAEIFQVCLQEERPLPPWGPKWAIRIAEIVLSPLCRHVKDVRIWKKLVRWEASWWGGAIEWGVKLLSELLRCAGGAATSDLSQPANFPCTGSGICRNKFLACWWR